MAMAYPETIPPQLVPIDPLARLKLSSTPVEGKPVCSRRLLNAMSGTEPWDSTEGLKMGRIGRAASLFRVGRVASKGDVLIKLEAARAGLTNALSNNPLTNINIKIIRSASDGFRFINKISLWGVHSSFGKDGPNRFQAACNNYIE